MAGVIADQMVHEHGQAFKSAGVFSHPLYLLNAGGVKHWIILLVSAHSFCYPLRSRGLVPGAEGAQKEGV